MVATRVGDCLPLTLPDSVEDLRRQFDEQHHVRLVGLFDASLMARITSELAVAEFETRTSVGVGSEWFMRPNALAAELSWLLNTPEVLTAVREITGSDGIDYFGGRVYRLEPATGQALSWHDDRQFEDRRLAISVNLGTVPHTGGVLRIREKQAPETIYEAPNVGAGDAILFRVADEVEHSVTPVDGTAPRIAFSGWFRTGRNYYDALLRQLRGEDDPG